MKDKYITGNCIPLIMGKTAVALVLVLFCLPFAFAGFYDGNISVTDIRININVSGDDVKMNSDYTLMNLGSGDESVLLTFPGYPKDKIVNFNGAVLNGALIVKVGETKMISVSANYKALGGNKLLNYNPTIFINGNGIAKKVNKIDTYLFFTSTNAKITNSEYDFTKLSTQSYLLSRTNVYPTSSYIGWVESNAKLEVSRAISNITGTGSSFTVVVKVKNIGAESVANIKLIDSLLARSFGSLQPSGDFVLVSGQMTDSSYTWEKSISSLSAGQEVVFQYSGKIEAVEGIQFNPLRVLVGDALLMFYEGPEIIAHAPARDSIENVSARIVNDSGITPIFVKKDETPQVISTPENLPAVNDTASQPILNQSEYNELSSKIGSENKMKTYLKYLYFFFIFLLILIIVFVVMYLFKTLKKDGGQNV